MRRNSLNGIVLYSFYTTGSGSATELQTDVCMHWGQTECCVYLRKKKKSVYCSMTKPNLKTKHVKTFREIRNEKVLDFVGGEKMLLDLEK